MKVKTACRLILICSAVVVAVAQVAARPQTFGQKRSRRLDKNGDGSVTPDEFAAYLKRRPDGFGPDAGGAGQAQRGLAPRCGKMAGHVSRAAPGTDSKMEDRLGEVADHV